jgi:hypothetical protein
VVQVHNRSLDIGVSVQPKQDSAAFFSHVLGTNRKSHIQSLNSPGARVHDRRQSFCVKKRPIGPTPLIAFPKLDSGQSAIWVKSLSCLRASDPAGSIAGNKRADLC